MSVIQGKVEINLDGIERRFQRAQRVLDPANLQKIMYVSGQSVGVEIESIARAYPPAPGGRPLDKRYPRMNAKGEIYFSKFKTPKQQGYFFGVLLPSGKTNYRRTGHLGRTITHKVTVSPDATRTTVTAGANAPYADVVIGSRQFYYHAITGWKQLKQQIEDNKATLKARFEGTFNGLIAKEF